MNETIRMEKTVPIWIALVPALIVPFIASLFYFVFLSEHPSAQVIYAATKIFTIVWPVLSLFFIIRDPFPKIRILSRENGRAVVPGIVSGLIIVLFMFLIMKTPIGDTIVAGGGKMQVKAEELGVLEYYWLFAIFLSLIHSLIEEYYWRWFVFGSLRRIIPGFLPHLIAGISFAAHHVVIGAQFFSLFLGILLGIVVCAGGVLWSMMYERQKTILGAWISHMIVDLGIMYIGYRLLFR